MSDGFESFVAEHADRAMRLARLLTGNRHDAEDLVQDAMARALTKWDAIAAARDRYAYFRVLMVNLHTGRNRRVRFRLTSLDHEGGPGSVSHSATSVNGMSYEDRDALSRAVATLPARQQAVLVLRYYEDLDSSEIAQVMGLTQSSVRSAQARALAAIKTTLTQAAASAEGHARD